MSTIASTTTNTPPPFKTVTKIVTFYSDGTFTEYTPAPTPPNPFTVPYQPYTNPYPWWQGPVSYGKAGDPIPCSAGWGVPTDGKSE
jgi:hypothetical protein